MHDGAKGNSLLKLVGKVGAIAEIHTKGELETSHARVLE
jgi:hypothetical protein